jgi:16S rRNA G1207 methylase RsmC
MCEPTTLLALSIASSAVGVAGQRAQANAQQRSIRQQQEAQAEEADAAAQQQMGKRVAQGRRERARLKVAAGEARSGGNSFESLLQNSLFQQDFDLADINKQAHFTQRAISTSADMAMSRVEQPNLALAGLQIAGAVSDYKNRPQ